MVGIGIDHISMARRLPIGAGTLVHVLGRLRSETSGTVLRWNLGSHGSCEIDVLFRNGPLAGDGSGAPVRFASSMRLIGPGHGESVTVTITLAADGEDGTVLEFRPTGPVDSWWCANQATYVELANATLEELAQELLFQHTRVRAELAS
jgi:hypothetical protein